MNDTGHIRTSQLLNQLAEDRAADDISFGEIFEKLGDRAFGPALLIFALPMTVPMIPGISTVFGLVLVVITFQMLIGAGQLWLPRRLTQKRISRSVFRKIVRKMVMILNPIEHMLKPRCSFILDAWIERVVAFLMLLMAFIIFLPIPGFNMIPALAISIVAVGYIERDGLVVMLGSLAALAVLGLIYGSLQLIITGFAKMLNWLAVPFGWAD